MTDIQKILPRRTDLSTFLVHLTRSTQSMNAKQVLRKIIMNNQLFAGSAFGHAHVEMSMAGWDISDQLCVCFTEVPLEYICLLTEPIEGRTVVLEPYGIAVTKRQARRRDANPVWYIDQTIGRTWLTNPLNDIVRAAIARNTPQHPIFRMTPFVEQFGDFKDFHWEREWRCIGSFRLPKQYLVIAPESDHQEFAQLIKENSREPERIRIIDAHWGLENSIARLAGFRSEDL